MCGEEYSCSIRSCHTCLFSDISPAPGRGSFESVRFLSVPSEAEGQSLTDNFVTGREQTLLQTLVLPACLLPTLLPTPLLEPRYFLVPYIFLRAQVPESTDLALGMEGAWYAAINAVTMYIFLYQEREGVGRFMW
jgi:hypothetical protein